MSVTGNRDELDVAVLLEQADRVMASAEYARASRELEMEEKRYQAMLSRSIRADSTSQGPVASLTPPNRPAPSVAPTRDSLPSAR